MWEIGKSFKPIVKAALQMDNLYICGVMSTGGHINILMYICSICLRDY